MSTCPLGICFIIFFLSVVASDAREPNIIFSSFTRLARSVSSDCELCTQYEGQRVAIEQVTQCLKQVSPECHYKLDFTINGTWRPTAEDSCRRGILGLTFVSLLPSVSGSIETYNGYITISIYRATSASPAVGPFAVSETSTTQGVSHRNSSNIDPACRYELHMSNVERCSLQPLHKTRAYEPLVLAPGKDDELTIDSGMPYSVKQFLTLRPIESGEYQTILTGESTMTTACGLTISQVTFHNYRNRIYTQGQAVMGWSYSNLRVIMTNATQTIYNCAAACRQRDVKDRLTKSIVQRCIENSPPSCTFLMTLRLAGLLHNAATETEWVVIRVASLQTPLGVIADKMEGFLVFHMSQEIADECVVHLVGTTGLGVESVPILIDPSLKIVAASTSFFFGENILAALQGFVTIKVIPFPSATSCGGSLLEARIGVTMTVTFNGSRQ
eukprot:Blabericola_migrator_1__52@NODE_1011_length_5710_cov_146_189615_g538_i1_p3_GENE_NODE_1011_length_5710_cov_146_189615_g538_i1NODE_1011_length_5710_cov_146_189615_g538_i1_p3_ORF_typecomplete_len443_score25_58_NODE_1011_length_5710_cov_146_189615_g538_i129144242